MKRPRRPSLIVFADEQVPIESACRLVGMDLPEDLAYGRNMKMFCPFGDLYHSDGGLEAAMRVYVESNHVFCFAGCGLFGPVALVAHAWDMTRLAAARELLERTGVAGPSRASVWARTQLPDPPDRALLAEALKTFCRRRVPGWATAQFDPAVAERFSACLALLDHVHTDEDAGRWLEACKAAMANDPTRTR